MICKRRAIVWRATAVLAWVDVMIRALKGCRFSGKNYSVGEVVPESAIEPKSLGALVKMKIISVTPDPPKKPVKKGKKDELQLQSC